MFQFLLGIIKIYLENLSSKNYRVIQVYATSYYNKRETVFNAIEETFNAK